MKNFFNKSILALVLCGISAGANAQSFTYNGINYAVTSTSPREVEVARNSGYSGAAVIPASVEYNSDTYDVTAIGEYAFENCTGLTSVTIGNSVTTIGMGAFYYCDSLTDVTIPNSVTTIGFNAFQHCIGLTDVTIPNSVTTIEDAAFASCTGLTSVTIPNLVTTIGESTFAFCSGLTSVDIGNSVITIGNYAFKECTGLTSVTIPNSVDTIGNYAFKECTDLTSITNLNPVPIGIPSDVFTGVDKNSCTLTVPTSSVGVYQSAEVWKDFAPNITGGGLLFCARANIPALGSVTSNIPDGLYTNNTEITITANPVKGSFFSWTSNGVDLGSDNSLSFTLTQDTIIIANFGFDITEGTLKDQPNIKDFNHLTIGGNIDARDVQFMRDSIPSLTELDLSGATIVAYTGTEGTNYGSNITYPANEMPVYSFFNTNTNTGKTSLVAVKLPDGLISIGQRSFFNCFGLTSVTIPNSVDTIGNNAFANCSGLTSVTIGNSVTTIGNNAFANCDGLTSVTIPDLVTTIGEGAFSNCSGLTSVTIPNSVITIGNYAFYYCSGLEIVYVKAINPPALGADVFNSVPTDIPVHVPCGSTTAYQSAAQWSSFSNYIEALFYLTVQSEDANKGTASITQANTCDNNTAVIAATPLSGYQFVQWSDGNMDNPRILIVTQDTVLTAIFESISGIDGTQTTALALYPNPVRDELFISGISGETKIVITDLSGRTVEVKNISPLQTGEISINLSALAKGVYLIKIGNYTGKIVKE